MFKQEFNVGDILQVELGNRTLVQRGVVPFIGKRGYVTGVTYGFDIYKEEECIQRINEELYLTTEIEDSKEPYVNRTYADEFLYYSVETIDSGLKYKLTFDGAIDNSDRTETLYFVFRKPIYEIRFAEVSASLFKKVTKRLTYDYNIPEEYLVKVGNKFTNDNAYVIPTFKERLLTFIKDLFIQKKSSEEILAEHLEKITNELK